METYYKKAEKYVKAVRKAIRADYNEVPEEWEAQLVQLEDMYATYLQCSEVLRREGSPITMINDGKTICASPYFTTMTTCVKTMDKIIKSFGLSPIARKVLKGSSTTVDEYEENPEL